MKEIRKECIVYDTVYVAVDGTEFCSSEECKKYEESAKGVLLTKYKPLVIGKTYEYTLFDCGSEDCNVDVVKINNKDEANIIEQLLYLYNPHLCKTEERYQKWNNEALHKITTALNGSGVLFINRGYDQPNEDNFYIMGSKETINALLNSFDNYEDDVEGIGQ